MPFVNETEGNWEYTFSFHNTAWEEVGMQNVSVVCTLIDNDLRTEGQMDAIAQDIMDMLAESTAITSYAGSKRTLLGAEITPTP